MTEPTPFDRVNVQYEVALVAVDGTELSGRVPVDMDLIDPDNLTLANVAGIHLEANREGDLEGVGIFTTADYGNRLLRVIPISPADFAR